MKIITGRTGENHVTSDDDRHLHAGTFGNGKYILNTGSKLNASNPASNVIRLVKGDIIQQGTHSRVEDFEDVDLEPGTEGYNRIDVICSQYRKKGGVESTSLVVYKGTPSAGEPTQPTPDYDDANILDGADIADMALYRITISGVNVTKIERIAELSTGLDDVYRKNEVYNKQEIDGKEKNLQDKINSTNTNLSNLSGDVSTKTNHLQSQIDTLSRDKANNTDIDGLSSEINGINNQISNLSSSKANATDLANLSASVSAIDARVKVIEDKIASL